MKESGIGQEQRAGSRAWRVRESVGGEGKVLVGWRPGRRHGRVERARQPTLEVRGEDGPGRGEKKRRVERERKDCRRGVERREGRKEEMEEKSGECRRDLKEESG